MPKDDNMAKKKEEEKRKKLNEQYLARLNEKHSTLEKTYRAQKEFSDRYMFAVLLNARDICTGYCSDIDVETLEKVGLPGNKDVGDYDTADNIGEDVLNHLTTSDSLEDFKAAYQMHAKAMMSAYLNVAYAYKKIYEHLKEPDENLRKKQAMYLLNESNDLGISLYYGAQNLFRTLTKIQSDSFLDSKIFKTLNYKEDKTTVADMIKALGYNEKEAKNFLETYNAKPEDDLLTVYLKKNNQEASMEKRTKKGIELANSVIYMDFTKRMKVKWASEINDQVLDNCGSKYRELLEFSMKFTLLGKNMYSEEDEKFNDWIEKKGKNMAKSLVKINTKQYFPDFLEKQIYSKKPLNYMFYDKLSYTYKDDKRYTSDNNKYRALPEITSFLEHKTFKDGENSNKFKNMIIAANSYARAMSRESAGLAIVRKEEMVKMMLNYVKGKKSLRSSKSAQNRFDMAMAVLSKYMEPDKFKRVVDRVNEVRGTGFRRFKSDESKQLVTVKYYSDLFDKYMNKGLEAAYSVQDAVKDCYVMVETKQDKQAVDDIANSFGKCPKLAPIGLSKEGDTLDRLDYAAVAYSYSITHENNFDEKVVSDAFSKYKQGKKAPLADIIANGIVKHDQLLYTNKGFDKDKFIIKAEFLDRMCNMLERDVSLKVLAFESGLVKDELEYAKSLCRVARYMKKAEAANQDILINKIKSTITVDNVGKMSAQEIKNMVGKIHITQDLNNMSIGNNLTSNKTINKTVNKNQGTDKKIAHKK